MIWKSSVIKEFFKLIVCLAIGATCPFFIARIYPSGLYADASYMFLIVGFLGLTTLASFFVLIWKRTDPESFTQLMLGSTVIKLIAYIVFVVVLILLDRQNANGNVVVFLTLYLIYTLAEAILLFRYVNVKNKV